MLDLPGWHEWPPPETVWITRVVDAGGAPWRPSRHADVLLLGDSFTNIYSLETMGWGTAAGFAEQLSRALRRPVDRIVQNDAGAFATRALLRRDPGRLTATRVVVHQFATRELSFGDWQVIPIPRPEAQPEP
jgi:alginate O-acetyltransferase complex protein AlgJ